MDIIGFPVEFPTSQPLRLQLASLLEPSSSGHQFIQRYLWEGINYFPRNWKAKPKKCALKDDKASAFFSRTWHFQRLHVPFWGTYLHRFTCQVHWWHCSHWSRWHWCSGSRKSLNPWYGAQLGGSHPRRRWSSWFTETTTALWNTPPGFHSQWAYWEPWENWTDVNGVPQSITNWINHIYLNWSDILWFFLTCLLVPIDRLIYPVVLFVPKIGHILVKHVPSMVLWPFPLHLQCKTGWWFQPTPLKNDGVSSSVGMMTFHSQLFMESHKIPWFQSPPTSHSLAIPQWRVQGYPLYRSSLSCSACSAEYPTKKLGSL